MFAIQCLQFLLNILFEFIGGKVPIDIIESDQMGENTLIVARSPVTV